MSISVAPGSLPPCRRIHQVSGGPGETGAAYPVTGLGLWVLGFWEPQGIAMNRSLVVAMGLALAAGATLSHAALAQSPFPPAPQQSSPFPPPPQPSGVCANFPKLRDEAKAKAELVSAIGKRKGDRKDMCAAVQNFTAAEDKVVKFLEENKVAWGGPPQAVTQ